MRLHANTTLFGCLAALLGGCANTGYSGDRSWAQGWREGKVETVRAEARWKTSCTDRIKADEQVVVVYYRSMGKPRWIELPVRTDATPVLSAKVLFNVKTCELVRL